MSKLYQLLAISLFIFSLSACKKEAKPISITGKWFMKSYIAISYINGVADTTEKYSLSVPDTAYYYEFYEGGKGLEAANPFINVVFNYSISGSNLILPAPLDRIPATSTITKPDYTDMILKGSTNFPSSSGNSYKMVQELHLTEQY
ncbi:MAG TPA: hypothetical protein DCO83_14940 [Mucilaginibacter sp.]|nr:hypothetical protein [Mucilaginibacter sp.]